MEAFIALYSNMAACSTEAVSRVHISSVDIHAFREALLRARLLDGDNDNPPHVPAKL